MLRNCRQTFPAMLAAIAAAQRTIDFSSSIYWAGDVTTKVTDALVERATTDVEGMSCRRLGLSQAPH